MITSLEYIKQLKDIERNKLYKAQLEHDAALDILMKMESFLYE